MSIKTYEQLTFTAAFLSERLGSATVYYNGQSITSASGYGFDTREFDDCICSLNVGTVTGAIATLVNDVYECDTDDPSAATALSGGNFPDINADNDERLIHGSILCKDTKRFLFLRTEAQGEPLTADFGSTWIGGTKRDTLLTPVSVQFDL